jgi:hypothetical protein
MITVDQINAMLHQLTLFRVPLDDFEEWLTGASWNMQKDSDQDAVRMVGRIERLLSELDEGYKSEAQVFRELGEIAGIFELSNVSVIPRVASSSARHGDPINVPFQWSAASDRPLGLGFSYIPLVPAAR